MDGRGLVFLLPKLGFFLILSFLALWERGRGEMERGGERERDGDGERGMKGRGKMEREGWRGRGEMEREGWRGRGEMGVYRGRKEFLSVRGRDSLSPLQSTHTEQTDE